MVQRTKKTWSQNSVGDILHKRCTPTAHDSSRSTFVHDTVEKGEMQQGVLIIMHLPLLLNHFDVGWSYPAFYHERKRDRTNITGTTHCVKGFWSYTKLSLFAAMASFSETMIGDNLLKILATKLSFGHMSQSVVITMNIIFG